jgi:hypothetical protein
VQDAIPTIDPGLMPPPIKGVAALAHRAFAGQGLPELLQFISRPVASEPAMAALALDCALAHMLHFRPQQASAMQALALDRTCLFRVAESFAARSPRPLRVLALMAPGDLMMNTPLDFITAHLDVQLDLMFVLPGRTLPERMPEHDVAFFAVSESDPAALRRLAPLFPLWPRPALNDPARVARLTRDGVAAALGRAPGIATPCIVAISREDLLAHLAAGVPIGALLPGCDYPVLLRPVGTHAGIGLARLDDSAALAAHLAVDASERCFLANFIDYRGPDGLFRKYRVAFIGGTPFVCHVASSEHWMVHYLNAGMVESEAKRAIEATAFADFHPGFAHRHSAALAAIDDWTGLDYHQIDCAETPDGRLLLFEADTAAIVHMMDPPDLFPYKPPQMRRVVDAFGAMLGGRAAAALAAA